jgi:hypothetical protein
VSIGKPGIGIEAVAVRKKFERMSKIEKYKALQWKKNTKAQIISGESSQMSVCLGQTVSGWGPVDGPQNPRTHALCHKEQS